MIAARAFSTIRRTLLWGKYTSIHPFSLLGRRWDGVEVGWLVREASSSGCRVRTCFSHQSVAGYVWQHGKYLILVTHMDTNEKR